MSDIMQSSRPEEPVVQSALRTIRQDMVAAAISDHSNPAKREAHRRVAEVLLSLMTTK